MMTPILSPNLSDVQNAKPTDVMGKWGAGMIKASENKAQVLVVEDEDEIRELIALHLRREGLDVDTAGSVEEALTKVAQKSYDLLALDWMLPGASGVEFAKRLRQRSDLEDAAILMITARTEPSDIVEGLEAGADDYLGKPFDPAVLIARVRALLRRSRREQTNETENGVQVVHIGDLALYPETYEAKCCGELVPMTPSEFKLMLALAANRGRVLTRDSLINQIQGEGVSVVGRTVDTHVFGLRKKLGSCADAIETVRGIGYRIKPNSES